MEVYMSRQFTGADGVTYTWVDADTFTDGKESYRVQGYNAPEEEKIVADEEKGLRFKQGQVGGKETTRAVERITEAGGFNIVEDLGKTDSFGRKRVKLKNEFGDDLTNTLYRSGAIDINLFTDEEGIQAAQSGRVSKLLNGKRQYDSIIAEELSEVQNRPVTFKETALNEREYLNSVVATIASQQGLDLADEDDYRTALNYAQDGTYDMRSLPFQGIEFRSPDRTIEGVAYNQFGTAWNQGWGGMSTGLAGFAELIGVGLGSETLEQWGADKVEQAKDDLLDAPMLRNLDYKDVDDVWSAWGYLTNNVAMSAPYLITLTAGTLAAPVTGGASAAIAYGSVGGSYAGQVWNDIQGEKGRAEAAGSILAGTGMAVLDRLGLAGILKPSQLLTKQGRLEVAKAVKAKNPKMTSEEALEAVNKASKAEIKGVIEGMGNFASDNINNSAILKRILTGAGRGGLTESITEAAQEGLGYSASAAMSEGGLKQNFNPNEFTNLLTSAAIAGGTLGAGFSSAGQVIDVGDRYAMQKGLMLGTSKSLNEYDRLSTDIGNVGSVEDIIFGKDGLLEQTKNKDPDNTNANVTVNYADRGKINRGNLWDKVKNAPKYLPELYRAAATTAFRPELLRRSEAARKLYALVGQPLGKLYSGRDVQAREAQVRADLLETINPKRTFKRFGMRDTVKSSQRISDMIRRYMNGERDIEVENNIAAIEATIIELENFAEKDYIYKNATYQNQKAGREALKKTDKWWLKHQSWDWMKVRQNRDEWFKFMRDNTDYTTAELDILYNKISNNEPATDFSLVEGVEFIPGSTKGRRDEISDKPGYEKFANTNILQNMIDAASQNAKYVAYTEYFGAGGKYLDQLFTDMRKDLSDEEIAEIAYHTKSIIDAGTGNFNPIQNKMLSKLQNTAAFYSAMVGLPLSAISSFPEFGMILYQGRGGKDVQNGINSATGTIVDMLKTVMNTKQNKALSNIPHANVDNKAQQRLTNSGLFNDDAAIATRLGLGETDISKAWWQKQFYKFSGIAGITQLQRAIAASAVSGFVSDRIRILAAKPADAEYNQDQLDVYVQLKNLGMDVDKMIELYNKYNNQEMFDSLMDADNATAADNEFINDQMDTVTWYFTNDRIQNPQAYNRPLFFQDPHYQLFVQFNGFISTFTANIVPRLYNDYLKNGSPTMKYNTFALMVTMMAMAGASQWLKDYIKFGQSTPYLSDAQLVQRAIQASGLLGTGERIVQMGLPLYKSRDQSLVDRFFGETIGGSPGVRNVATAIKGIEALGEGDTNRAVKQATKLIPGIGPITPVRNTITDLVHGRTPNPYPFRENE